MNGSEHDPWLCKKCGRDNMPQSNSPGETHKEWEDRLRVGYCRACWTKLKYAGSEVARRQFESGLLVGLIAGAVAVILVVVLAWLVHGV